MFAFASGKYDDGKGKAKQLVAVNVLRIAEGDYFDFLRLWVAWLKNTGIQKAMAA